MKRISKILFIFVCLVIININYVNAVTVDKNPPKLISFNIEKKEVAPGEYLDLDIQAEDDVSGFGICSIALYSPIKGYAVYRFDIEDMENPKILIPKDAIGGEYQISDLMLRDKKDNIVTYYNKSLYPNDNDIFNISYDFGDNIVKITSDTNFENDKENPVVSNVTVDLEKISLGESLKICAKITDASEIKNASCVISLKDNAFYRLYEDMIFIEGQNLYCASFKPSRSGTYNVSEIYASDIYDNGTTNALREDLKASIPSILVEGPKNDEEAPSLLSIKLNKKSIIAPGSIKVFVDAEDNSGEISSVTARFISEEYYNKNIKNGSYSDGELLVVMHYDEVTGKYVGTLNINQYALGGKYFLQYLVLSDNSNNSAEYVTNHYPKNMSGGYSGILLKREEIDDLYFELKEEFAYDVITSTINKNMLEIIKNQKDDAIIMIDATNDYILPSEVFEIIKGTNKTLYVEANGYQWVFNGQDINNIKSINTYIYTELLADQNIDNNSKEYISIVFADNGLLPGKAKIRVKTDYTFRYIEGYENLKLYFYNPSEEKYKSLDNIISLTDDGFYEFDITHNSKYIMSNKEINIKLLSNNEEIIENNTNSNNQKSNNNYLYIIVSSVLVIGIISTMILISKRKNK